MQVCLFVFSVIGLYCYENAEPIGVCQKFPNGMICFVDAEELPVRASWYDPFLETDSQEVADIQCMEPCHLLGDGTAVEDAYGWAVACPLGWHGRWITVQFAGTWQCRDSGGAIRPTWMEVFIPGEGMRMEWFLTLDFLLKEQPSWAYLLLPWKEITLESSSR